MLPRSCVLTDFEISWIGQAMTQYGVWGSLSKDMGVRETIVFRFLWAVEVSTCESKAKKKKSEHCDDGSTRQGPVIWALTKENKHDDQHH